MKHDLYVTQFATDRRRELMSAAAAYRLGRQARGQPARWRRAGSTEPRDTGANTHGG